MSDFSLESNQYIQWIKFPVSRWEKETLDADVYLRSGDPETSISTPQVSMSMKWTERLTHLSVGKYAKMQVEKRSANLAPSLWATGTLNFLSEYFLFTLHTWWKPEVPKRKWPDAKQPVYKGSVGLPLVSWRAKKVRSTDSNLDNSPGVTEGWGWKRPQCVIC